MKFILPKCRVFFAAWQLPALFIFLAGCAGSSGPVPIEIQGHWVNTSNSWQITDATAEMQSGQNSWYRLDIFSVDTATASMIGSATVISGQTMTTPLYMKMCWSLANASSASIYIDGVTSATPGALSFSNCNPAQGPSYSK